MAPIQRHRIVYLIDALGMGGAECLMAGFLQHLDRSRYDPVVCALAQRDGNPVTKRITDMGLTVDVLGVRRLLAVGNVTRMRQYLRRQRAELVHCHLEFSATLGSLAARQLDIPAVTTFHTLDAFSPWTRAHWRHKLMRRTLRHCCDRMIAVSQSVREHHLRLGLYDPNKVVTIYNGIDLSRFDRVGEHSRTNLRRTLGVPEGAPLAISVCVLRPAKGVQHLIAAMPAMLAAQPELRLLIVGDGAHETTLRAAVQSHNLTRRVIFTGRRDDIPELMAAGDLFVLPTLDDALPTVLSEAMAAGKPIVTTHVGGVPEMIEHERNGLLVPPGDPAALAQACLQVLADPQRARDMGRAGRRIVEERFDIRVQTRRTSELYQTLLTARAQTNNAPQPAAVA